MLPETLPDIDFTKGEASLIAALYHGTSDPATQRRALEFLLTVVCADQTIPLAPGNPDVTAFHCGRQWVARQIKRAYSLPIDKFKDDSSNVETSKSTRVPTATERSRRTR